MKTLAVALLACWSAMQLAVAATENDASGLKWMTDLPKAQAQAKAEHKMLLLEFTGSDWCPPCKMLKRQVFSSPEFKEFAKKNLVLAEADFPRSAPISAEQKSANEALRQKFNVDGFPTVIVFDSQGKELSREMGYDGTPAQDYVAKLQALAKK